MSNKIKDNTREVVLSLFKKYDYRLALDICKKMYFVDRPKNNKDDWSDCKGEICEAVLEGLINKCKKDDWVISKGLILRDPTNTNFLTESDLVVFTPSKIVLFECKSYDGNKKLIDKCTINRSSGKRDVYSQNKLHADILIKNISDFYEGYGNPVSSVQLSLFLFCKGSVEDNRTKEYRGIMPSIGPNNIFKFMDVATKGKKVWNMKYIRSFVRKVESTNVNRVEEHLSLVKSLHK